MEDRKESFDDILTLPHPTSATHPRMALQDRAAQFSPFAALTGFDDYLADTEKDNLQVFGE